MDNNYTAQTKLIETALLTTNEALSVTDISNLFAPPLTTTEVATILNNLVTHWQNRGIHLSENNEKWRFIVEDSLIDKIPHLKEEKNPKYSRAVLETLTIIAYKQPITRTNIEEVRGVSVSSQIIQTLIERGWIENKGIKEVIGRPVLWGTTTQFLVDFCLKSLAELPPLNDLNNLIQKEDVLWNNSQSKN